METTKGKLSALLPIGVFLVIFLGMGCTAVIFTEAGDCRIFNALMVAFLQNRKVSFNEKIKMVASGVGDENIITMCLIFLAAGAFSGCCICSRRRGEHS